jgi:hypothetical protein
VVAQMCLNVISLKYATMFIIHTCGKVWKENVDKCVQWAYINIHWSIKIGIFENLYFF